jgi:hypothetical protein
MFTKCWCGVIRPVQVYTMNLDGVCHWAEKPPKVERKKAIEEFKQLGAQG